MKRLTVKNEDGTYSLNDETTRSELLCRSNIAREKLGRYEDMEEQGRLIILDEVLKRRETLLERLLNLAPYVLSVILIVEVLTKGITTSSAVGSLIMIFILNTVYENQIKKSLNSLGLMTKITMFNVLRKHKEDK